MKDKQKIVQVIGAADAALTKLQETVHVFEAQGKTPPKDDAQLLKSVERALDLLKANPFAGDRVKRDVWPRDFNHFTQPVPHGTLPILATALLCHR